MALVNYSFTALIDTDPDGDNSIAAQAVSVKIDLDGALAVIYEDEAGTTPITQPGAVTDINGVLEFWVEAGIYQISDGTRTETVIIDNGSRLIFDDVAAAKISKHTRIDDEITIIDRGNGKFITVLSSGVTDNDFDIIESTADPLISFVILDFNGDIKKLGAVSSLILNPIIERSLVLVNRATLSPASFDVLVSAPFDISAGKMIDFGSNTIARDGSFVANAQETMFNHIGDDSIIKNVEYDNIGATERLIGYTSGADNCIEEGCGTGRGNNSLIKFEGVTNNNYSETLDIASKGKLDPSKELKKFTFHLTTADATTAANIRRARFIPSISSISHINVTDANGSPDFYFEIRMNDGGVTFPFVRARTAADIDSNVNIDWFQDSFDDLMQVNIQNYKGGATTFDIEIYYRDGRNGFDDTAWVYQSSNDFNRPHNFGAATIQEAQRGIEYRSYIDGSGLDVTTATPDRAIDINYNYANVTIPTPAGVRDTNETTELKFYFNFSAEKALVSGATHIRFRVYQQTQQIKCTCINGFLSQVPDWSADPAHLATSFQPDVEIDLTGATQDVPQEVLIPLDRKAMMNAASETQAGDLKYFYLTFFQNLPGHVAIEWGDVWQWDCQFIRL